MSLGEREWYYKQERKRKSKNSFFLFQTHFSRFSSRNLQLFSFLISSEMLIQTSLRKRQRMQEQLISSFLFLILHFLCFKHKTLSLLVVVISLIFNKFFPSPSLPVCLPFPTYEIFGMRAAFEQFT